MLSKFIVRVILASRVLEMHGLPVGGPCQATQDCDIGSFCAVECFVGKCFQAKNVCQPCDECKEGDDAVDGSCDRCLDDDDKDADDRADGEGEGNAARGIASKVDRHACKYYQQMMCLLDISEKVCEPDEQPLPLLEWAQPESVWLCCCPLPYKACGKSEMSDVCLTAVEKYLSKATVKDKRGMMLGLQKARGQMQQADEVACSSLASEKPLSVCGFEGSPQKKRSVDRQDLFCEMVTWQWEELGDGNPDEFQSNGCIFDKKAKSKSGSERKGGQLQRQEL